MTLIIHLGYPKTGTTTLQNILFYNLHKKEDLNINYIGITKNETSSYFNKLREKFYPWLKSKGTKNEDELLSFLRERLKDGCNLCSEESLLNSWENPPKLFEPEDIKKLFSKLTNNIQIILVLRNQVDMIYSLFVHSGGQYSRSKYNSSEKFIDYCTNDTENNSFFKFYDLIKNYQNFFGEKNVHVLFFEDLKYNTNDYLNQLAFCLEQPFEIIQSNLGDGHIYKKERSSDGSYYKVLKNRRKWEPFIKYSPFTDQIKKFLIALKIYDKIKLIVNSEGTFKQLIPKFSDEQKNYIKKYYSDNNHKLAQILKCDQEKLKKYNYL